MAAEWVCGFMQSHFTSGMNTSIPYYFILTTPFTRHIWHHSRAKPDLMRKAALDYDWDNNLNDNPNEMVDHFDEIVLNIA